MKNMDFWAALVVLVLFAWLFAENLDFGQKGDPAPRPEFPYSKAELEG